MHGGQHKQHHGHGPDDDHMVHSHGQHAGHSTAMFKDRFWLTLALSVPVVFFSPMFAHLLGYMPPEFPGSAWIPPALGTVIFFYGGMPFLKGGLSELKTRKPGMMLLIAMAISVAFIASWATTLRIGDFDLDFWWELALLVAIMLLGHWIEMRALGSAQGALDALAALLPDEAERVTPNGTETVPVTDLAPGDVVLVRSGARMPADGTIVEGQAEFDESMITGESKTVARGPGDPVVAGTVATDNTVRVRVTAVGEDTALAGIQRLVAEAQASSSKAQALADRAAAFLFYFATIAGVVTFIAWILLGSLPEAVTRTVTVLVIACPHALGLAIPLVIAISTEQAARVGVLIKNRMALERMRTVDVVLFDKTGTLTKGEPELKDITAVDGTTPRELLAVAAAVESDSEHPVARAIVRAAHHQGLDLPTATGFSSMTGRGVRAMIDGRTVQVGGPALLRELDLTETDAMAATTRQWAGRGAAVLHVVDGDRILGAVSLEDAIRPESRQAVKALQARGIKVALITGDARQVADAVGAELGIDEVFAEVLPADKDKKVAQLQARGLKVAMVGDGVNDSPALARAEVGIAIGAGTDVAMESAGVILAGNDPRAVLSMVDLSRASYTKMWQNLIWATGYNIIAVPLAAGVLAFAGVVLSPAAGAVLMSASTIVVALNAQLLRRVKLNPSQVR
ncbi:MULTISPECIES: heavy metal translocating P-type ATPase [Paenarthrobacter]|uniref:Heavy metal translocating P-type ATPase n=2 Tax=Micrococcaceae TaxID=1268 RepID=A0AAX3EPE9_PAEUR|nr:MULTISPECIES: heavy metal translocating P-type ATPase [Paenarthrobacter]MDO5864423.1 heavy metal translocating P-type ATPase [Paenarthrobacter sp. SD-2]MDO5875499.1 heavy metal translocating P-type ATPase [Paenarthrobacter sp. SD-1]UYV95213.1 heavy metal translocating P-type ATPase [Paenarthrobacter ureafaciens]UYV99749.1 heavy metal translocating P-type ATPase [Paenarthrobacter ureafaciens]WIV33393.1 heavy metal translocating P-type ATPase [Paenarthrobacter sp. R1]